MEEGGDEAAMAFLGDRNSENAFAELFGWGLAGLVASQRCASRADIWIRTPAELMEFLEDWSRAVRSGKTLAKTG